VLASNLIPLCVDLDGTLVKSDLLIEALLLLLRHNPLAILLVPFWLLKGKAYLKQELARRVKLDVAVLPYHAKFVAWLRAQHSQGQKLILTTASPHCFAQQISDYLGIFDEVLATEGQINLAGQRKCQKLCQTFGERNFDYAGNARVDVAVWSHARNAILVNSEPGVRERLQGITVITQEFTDTQGNPVQLWLRAIRFNQWLKNILVFVPLLASHRVFEPGLLLHAAVAFLSFGLCASSAYLLNDLLDLPVDRRHPRKNQRPFAAGKLPIRQGILAIPLLLGIAILITIIVLSSHFLAVLLGYFVLTLTYSLYLKQIPMLDVVVLAFLYSTRIIAGGTAVRIMPSFWLLAFSMFIFLSLAMVKRYTELVTMEHVGERRARGRGYHIDDMVLLQALGGSSGYLSVLVLALYINSPSSEALYRYPEALWFLCPLLLYWISRIWFETHRGQMHDDPLIFAVEDRVSWIVAILGVFIIWIAT
jgi:4-hydroxybenzoate polyprenyltransferase